MNEYKISEDIYRDSLQLNKGSHKISEDIYEEAISLTSERISEIIMDSYHFQVVTGSGKWGFIHISTTFQECLKPERCKLKLLD